MTTPALSLESWRDTRDTLHMWTQIVGKTRNISCVIVANASSAPNLGARSVGITLGAGGDITCTFVLTFTPLTVTIDQAVGQQDPVEGFSGDIVEINFDVVFSNPVYGFEANDVALSGDGWVGIVYPVDFWQNRYRVQTFASSSTTITATIPAGVATDFIGQTNPASTSTDNSVAVYLEGGGVECVDDTPEDGFCNQ